MVVVLILDWCPIALRESQLVVASLGPLREQQADAVGGRRWRSGRGTLKCRGHRSIGGRIGASGPGHIRAGQAAIVGAAVVVKDQTEPDIGRLAMSECGVGPRRPVEI